MLAFGFGYVTDRMCCARKASSGFQAHTYLPLRFPEVAGGLPFALWQ
jgi:hypothetical protein